MNAESNFPKYESPWPAPPAGFAERVLNVVREEHAVRRRRVWLVRAGTLSLAASIALVFAIGYRLQPQQLPANVAEIEPKRKPLLPKAPIQKSFAEAGEALAKSTRASTDKALAPTQTLLATAERFPMLNPVEPMGPPDPKPWSDTAASARDGLEPVAGQPKRAMNRMLRDFGLGPKPRI